MLKIFNFILILSLLIFWNIDINHSQTKYKYVGVNTCVGACHNKEDQGDQLLIWKESAHSKAFLNLQTEAADSIARSRGYLTAAAETPQCVRCHLLGTDTDESLLLGSFDKSQGVQCESCHGPGSEYKKLSVMKDKDKAMSNGLILHSEKEKFCIQCHNEESPTYFEFDYEPMWKMIAHHKPK
jgi:excinuclease UvrABC ATPase subunit